jgi:hypothetical protein
MGLFDRITRGFEIGDGASQTPDPMEPTGAECARTNLSFDGLRRLGSERCQFVEERAGQISIDRDAPCPCSLAAGGNAGSHKRRILRRARARQVPVRRAIDRHGDIEPVQERGRQPASVALPG